MPPVKPRDAASLILVREGARELEVFMGRRAARSKFMPSVYVFPGGGVDPSDHALAIEQTLGPEGALRSAAIRETFEETGLRVTKQGNIGTAANGTWADLAALGEVPEVAALTYVGRAITPSNSPIRFHARFFLANADRAQGEPRTKW